MPEPDRRTSGYRDYPQASVRMVRFIKQAQDLGFTLEDIGQLLRLAAGKPRNCRTVRALAIARIEEMSQKISMLLAMRASLKRLVRTCHRSPGKRDCPLLEALEESVK